MSLYYDPQNDMEISVEGVPQPSWINITAAMAQQLGEARKQGARVYVSANGVPTAFFTPEKPDVDWNESTHLMPFEVVDGEASQYWAITKISVEEQAAKLAALRWEKQNTGLLYQDPDTQEWLSTNDPSKVGSVYIPTDTLTMTTLMGIKADYESGINIERDWKIGNLNFVTFTNEQLANAYKVGQEYWQSAFSIERKYAAAIVTGTHNVNIYEWSL